MVKVQPMAYQRVKTFHLSVCSEDYLRALLKPFDETTRPACIPDQIDVPSYKTRTLMRGSLQTGSTAGSCGFVLGAPFASCMNNSTAVLSSTSNYTFTGFPGAQNDTGVTSTLNAQAPYPYERLGTDQDDVQVRPVAFGLRVRYIGNELYRSGRILFVRMPNAPLAALSVAQILARSDNFSVPVDKKWHTITYMPYNASAYQYKTTYPESTLVDSASIGFLIDGAAASSPFEWEAISYSEITGATPNITLSHSDVQGISAVRNTLEHVANDGSTGEGVFARAQKYINSMTPDDISGWVEKGARIASATAPLLRGMNGTPAARWMLEN